MRYRALKTLTLYFVLILLIGCGGETDNHSSLDESTSDSGMPTVKSESTYLVGVDEDLTYAEGLAHSGSSTSSFAMPLKLDVYYPDNNSTNRPVYMFIHGGGFKGGTKTKPEIVEMANYYASRYWHLMLALHRKIGLRMPFKEQKP